VGALRWSGLKPRFLPVSETVQDTITVISWLVICRPQHHGLTPKGTPEILAGIGATRVIMLLIYIVSHSHLLLGNECSLM